MSTEEAKLDELVAQYLAQKGRPEGVDAEAFATRHPEHAEELRDVLQGMELMERADHAFSARDAMQALDTLAVLGRARRRQESIVGEGPARSDGRGRCAEDHVSRALAGLEAQGAAPQRYVSEGELARGGQGAILAIWDETLQRHLAMKVALASVRDGGADRRSDARSLGRFLEEAHVTAQLDHPGIVPVHDLGLDRERQLFFTMKLVKGRDLRRIFELVRTGEEGWNETRALNVLLKVCEAMAYAHSKGVIHRDLKPGNVMVGKFGEVYVMDWGLARVLGSVDSRDIRIQPAQTSELRSARSESGELDSALVTMDGDVVGTPAYMPPEQARGELVAMGPHSDVYAVGAMLYQLLTAQMPYAAGTARLSSRAIWALVQKGPPEPVHALARNAPEELVAICEKAMAREVSARYPDMGALGEDLRAYLEHRVVQAHRTGALVELRKWVRRNQGTAGAIAAAFVLLVAGLAVSLLFKTKADRSAKLALDNALAASQNERTATERADEVLRLSAFQRLADLAAEADRLWPAEPELISAYERWLDRAQELVASLDPGVDSPGHRAQLAKLRARAKPLTEEERSTLLGAHPRFEELERQRKMVAALQAARDVREHGTEPVAFAADLSTLPASTEDLEALARVLVDPDRTEFGREAEGLALARLAIERVEDDAGAARAGATLAWALLANGLDEPARAESAAALEAAPAAARSLHEKEAAALEGVLKAARDGSTLAEAERELAALEAGVSVGSGLRFAEEADTWWNAQLERLVAAIEALADPETGLIRGISESHGWGFERRLAFAATITERSIAGAEAARQWAEAIASIADPLQCPAYSGLRIVPQLGLLPIGRDATSGLWEFAHLQTGEPARRGADGRLVIEEATGLVFVLLPGGSFTMGAQAGDPAGPNYDPEAEINEVPPHVVAVTPFFLSKYEMTQGQWQRIAGRNPSYYGPHYWRTFWSRAGREADLAQPVEQVSWETGTEVMARLGLQLPSEAQWEYGARAGTSTAWCCGNERSSLASFGNLADRFAKENLGGGDRFEDWDDGYVHHARVGCYPPNGFGLHDVIGNIWELCSNEYYFYRGSPDRDAMAKDGSFSRVNRGGSFVGLASPSRSAARDVSTPSFTGPDLGLRPAMTLRKP